MIGVCISTTPARRELFSKVYEEWDKHMPDDAILTYVSDEDGAGVAITKNASLKLLEDLGVTDYFLVDDDVIPLSDDWWMPYVFSNEVHMMYQFKLPDKGSKDMRVEYEDENIVSYSHTRGAFLYFHQLVLDTVGGFDTRYVNGFEHPDLTNRIFNAGLTSYRAMDVPYSHELLYCHDQDGSVQSSISTSKKVQRANYQLYKANKGSQEYIEYR